MSALLCSSLCACFSLIFVCLMCQYTDLITAGDRPVHLLGVAWTQQNLAGLAYAYNYMLCIRAVM